jgi:DNA primase
MLLHQHGIKNAVASLGTALTSEQVRLLARFTKNIILVFDSDIAGLGASIKGFEKLKEYNENIDLFNENNINIKVCILDKDYDPADFILKKGPEEFHAKLEKAVNIIDFNIDFIIKKYDLKDLSSKISALSELLNFIMGLESRIVQEECIKKISIRLDIKDDLILEELQRKSSKSNKKFNININQNNEKALEPKSNLKKIEIEALTLIIQGSDFMITNIDTIEEAYFRFSDTKQLFLLIREAIIEAKNNEKDINFPIEISSDRLIDEKLKTLYNSIFFNTKEYSDEKGSSAEVLMNLKKLFITDKITKLRKKMLDIEIQIQKEETIQKKDQLKKIYDDIYNYVIELEIEKLNRTYSS